ncbi:MAG: MotA/TolQ/ExbB proton channel family protein [Candidatus Cloacimonadota bacterium]|nr:MAG: MotA/TolQ/ExbB proton channel family protein [Candidatus Cloacimonadota bacterium]
MVFLLSSICAVVVMAQADTGDVQVDSVKKQAVEPTETAKASGISGFESFARQIVGSGLVDLYIQGGFVMWPMLILVIWAVATIIWRIVALRYAKINVNNLLEKITPYIEENNIDEAIEICAKTRGPVANILHAGLLKADQGIEAVEKAIEGAGILEMSFLEKGLVALATTINLAPMLGFLGTVVGMIRAFQSIAAAGEVEPTIVASGISEALITTAAGLAVAIPVQLCNNLFVSMIDGMVIDMQKGSEKLIETLVAKK